MLSRLCSSGRASHGWNDRREMQLLAALGALLIYAKGPGPEADAAWTKALKSLRRSATPTTKFEPSGAYGRAFSTAASSGCR